MEKMKKVLNISADNKKVNLQGILTSLLESKLTKERNIFITAGSSVGLHCSGVKCSHGSTSVRWGGYTNSWKQESSGKGKLNQYITDRKLFRENS